MWIRLNANPANRNVGDCVVRAIAVATGRPWTDVYGIAAVMYALGTLWFMVQSGNGLAASLALCVTPFLPAEVVKIAAACLLAWPIRRAVYRN